VHRNSGDSCHGVGTLGFSFYNYKGAKVTLESRQSIPNKQFICPQAITTEDYTLQSFPSNSMRSMPVSSIAALTSLLAKTVPSTEVTALLPQ
jgi:hypothetical protein